MGSQMNYGAALKSFMGHLEGTQKSFHTLKSYRLDLLDFEDYLRNSRGGKPFHPSEVVMSDVEGYHDHLKNLGQRMNTRRRKLMTLRKFLSYLAGRKKITIDLGRIVATPHKVERTPRVVELNALLEKIKALPSDTALLRRNRLLLWTMAETGCLVSEVGLLKSSSLQKEGASYFIEVCNPKAPRKLAISPELGMALGALQETGLPALFTGFNKFGSLGLPISSRGVELLVKVYAARLELEELTPRMIRHSVVLNWHRQGATEKEIQRRLGLKSTYAFRNYAPLFAGVKSSFETTSNA